VKRAYFILALAATLVRADSLEDVLKRMDQAAATFRSMSANLHKTIRTEVLDDTEVNDGTIKMIKNGKDKFALLAKFEGRDPLTLHVSGHTAEMYYPKANTVQIYDTSKTVKSVDQYLFVGWGTPLAELKKTYAIAPGGAETIDGVKATRIDLTPVSKEAKKIFNKIQLWFPDGKAYPMQEKIFTSDGYKLFQYSNAKILTTGDPEPPASDFQLNLPAGVKRQEMK
jgi:outer membrane lipoprotein-sorting protein